MKSLLATVSMLGLVLLLVFSCATVPKTPLAPGEVKLLSMDPVGAGIDAHIPFRVNVFFTASGNPNIKRVCFYEPKEEPLWFDASNVSYLVLGSKRAFQVYLPGLSLGSHRVECYVEYIQNGETRRTNVVFTQIITSVHAGG